MRVGLALLCLALVSVTLCGCGRPPAGTDGGSATAVNATDEPKPVKLKLSLILGENSEWYAGAKKWQELVQAQSSGKVRVSLYPEAQLANHNQRTELEMVQSGAIDCSLESNILLSILDQRWSVFSLPWLFPDHETAKAVCDGPLGDMMLATLAEKGLVGLAYGVNGFRQITNNKRPIRTPADMRDLKIRVPGIKMYIGLFQMMGADPSSMNFGELFAALRQGTMDGQENPLTVIKAAKLYEVQKHLTVWDYSYDPIILCMNKDKWDSLTAQQQEVLQMAAREAFDYERQLIIQQEEPLRQELADAGMQVTVLDRAEREAFAAQVSGAYQQYASDIGADLIKQFRDAAVQAASHSG